MPISESYVSYIKKSLIDTDIDGIICRWKDYAKEAENCGGWSWLPAFAGVALCSTTDWFSVPFIAGTALLASSVGIRVIFAQESSQAKNEICNWKAYVRIQEKQIYRKNLNDFLKSIPPCPKDKATWLR